MSRKFEGKCVVITGGSSGIGRAIAQAFSAKGARVIVLGQNKPDYPVEFHQMDVAKEESIRKVMEKISSIDVLVNNAGVCMVESVAKSSRKSLDEMVDTNMKGVFWTTKFASPRIRKGGCIITISSIAGLQSFEEYSIYCATKAAVISLSNSFAVEFVSKGIRSNCIAPGIIDTPIWEKMYGADGRKKLQSFAKGIPAKRPGKPEEIAHAALFLAENEFVNGIVLTVDGGELVYEG